MEKELVRNHVMSLKIWLDSFLRVFGICVSGIQASGRKSQNPGSKYSGSEGAGSGDRLSLHSPGLGLQYTWKDESQRYPYGGGATIAMLRDGA